MSYWCHVCPACVELELWEWEDRSPFSSKDCSCTSANSWLVNPGHNWTSWRTAHISRLSTDHREKSICEVIKAVPQATVMHVQEVVQYSMFTPTHSFKMFQNVSSSIVSRSFRTVSLAGWAANTLNQASLGTWTGCAQIFTAPPNPLGPSGLSVHVCILWFSDKKSGSLHNDRKDQVSPSDGVSLSPIFGVLCRSFTHDGLDKEHFFDRVPPLKMVWYLSGHQHARKTLEIKRYKNWKPLKAIENHWTGPVISSMDSPACSLATFMASNRPYTLWQSWKDLSSGITNGISNGGLLRLRWYGYVVYNYYMQ